MTRPVLVAIATAGVALTAAGCGGSTKTSSSTSAASTPGAATSVTQPATTPVQVASGTPLSRSVWITKGDAICARLNAQLKSSVVKTTADLVRVLPQAAVYEHVALGQLSQLVPPTARAHDWQELLRNVQGWTTASERLSREAQAGNFKPEGWKFAAGSAYHEAFARIAKHSGFKQCSVT